ncbi:hypothetical protein ABZZ47_08720 [Streptomyces sp. NPDC006465]|uniref:hypothetical protein n=1 Tax=Streptomyces sp. NPDC006465 TaxID=3157174 RepID=UPI0033A7A11C
MAKTFGGDADSVNACVKFVRHGRCNYWTNVGRGWKTITTDVKDGTHFKLRVHAYDTDAQVVPFPLAY